MPDYAISGWAADLLPLSPAGEETPGRYLYDASCYGSDGEVCRAIVNGGKMQLHRRSGKGHCCFWKGSCVDPNGIEGEYIQDAPDAYNVPSDYLALKIIPVTVEVSAGDHLERRRDVALSVCEACPEGLFRRMKSRFIVDCATGRCGGCGGVSVNHTCPKGHWDSEMFEAGLFRESDIARQTPSEVVADMLRSGWTAKGMNGNGWQHWPNVQEAYRQVVREVSAGSEDDIGHGRGIVLCAGGDYFVSGYVSIRVIRHLGCDLPIELWLLPDEVIEPWQEMAIAGLDVTVRRPAAGITIDGGWQLKYHAICKSAFREVFFFDADCYPLINPAAAFDWQAYAESGCFLWLDKWRDHPRDDSPGALLSKRTYEALGIPYSEELTKDSGAMLIDKLKHGRSLMMADWMNRRQWRYYYRDKNRNGHVYGDKDLLWIAMRSLGEYYATSSAPWASAEAGGYHIDPDGKPFCFHSFAMKFVLGSASRAAMFPRTWQRPEAEVDHPMKAEITGFVKQLTEIRAANPPRLHAVSICINYDDYLLETIANKRFFTTWTIVTEAGDPAVKLAEEWGLDVIITDRKNYLGSKFNLGAMRREAFYQLAVRYPQDWIGSLDADVILPDDFGDVIVDADLNRKKIYGAKRQGDGSEAGDHAVSGFCQIFHASHVWAGRNYRDDHHDAGCTDIMFRDLWPKPDHVTLPAIASHLGRAALDWEGRVSVGPRMNSPEDPWNSLLKRPEMTPSLQRESRWLEFFGRFLPVPEDRARWKQSLRANPPRLYSREAYAQWAWERYVERGGELHWSKVDGWPQSIIGKSPPKMRGEIEKIYGLPVKVYGLQRTGTNLAALLLKENYSVTLLREEDAGWKHGKHGHVPGEWEHQAGFVLCVRHPLSQAASFYRYCLREHGTDITIHEQFKPSMTFEDFIKSECYKFASPIHRWNGMYRHWLDQLPQDRTVIVRQEDQFEWQGWTVSVMGRKLGLSPRHNFRITSREHVDANFLIGPEPPAAPALELFTDEIKELAVSQIDRELLEKLGYII